jgi:hypothetical protein
MGDDVDDLHVQIELVGFKNISDIQIQIHI